MPIQSPSLSQSPSHFPNLPPEPGGVPPLFINDFKVNTDNNKSILSLDLKYHYGNPVISAFERVSKPGRRIFSSADGLPKINNGLGIAIISTPKGVMTDIDARKQRVGGEIICKVF